MYEEADGRFRVCVWDCSPEVAAIDTSVLTELDYIHSLLKSVFLIGFLHVQIAVNTHAVAPAQRHVTLFIGQRVPEGVSNIQTEGAREYDAENTYMCVSKWRN
jgi:hypothetical protein